MQRHGENKSGSYRPETLGHRFAATGMTSAELARFLDAESGH
jgi:hypothetical protein